VRRPALLFVVVAGAFLAPATPAFAHAGSTPSYRTTVTGISTPEKGLSVRTVEAGSRLELANHTGHSVEVLGYSGEPYLDLRPDGTYQNANSPSAEPALPTADPTAPPDWRRISTATTVRWHDHRTHGPRNWSVPLREQARTFAITGTSEWVTPPPATLWWLGAGLFGLTAIGLVRRWSGLVRPLALIGGLASLSYAVSRAADGGSPPLVLFPAGVLALAAVRRPSPFYLTLAGLVVLVFGGVAIGFGDPSWFARVLVLLAAGAGLALTVTGGLRLRTSSTAAAPPSGLSSSA
jgi:hypothetical protein